MTTRRPSRRPATPFARRGVLLAGPTLLLAGCGLLPGGTDDEKGGDAAAGQADEDAADGAAEATNPATSAVVDLQPTEVTDEAVAGRLMSRLETSQTLLAPRVKATVTASGLVDSLTAADYTALTGEEPPAADDAEEGTAAETILPGERKQFLLAAWESTDSEWQPAVFTHNSTTLNITHGGNTTNIHVPQVAEGDAERSGIVLAIVDRSPAPEAMGLRAEIRDGVSEISLVDGSILATPSPSLYERELGVEVTDAGIVETEVDEGWVSGVMSVRGTVKSAFLTPYIDTVDYGGNLFWAAADELHLVVDLDWQMEFSSNVVDRTEATLTLEDGTELRPAQDTDQIFYDSHGTHIATFTIPADERSATLTLSPRFTQVIDKDFEQIEDPITATLTFS
ncbi:hypothetical protein [Brachybacterium paraconglomeratum]|uniref:hypothetical protein n=1 Tax=Brachybacterium paraconglomeratum TaxID=173362 RepID=UPI00223C2380|nr:hypothetical protein [Brachybacterium paraconglomeratum]MCT1437180.1 hypothetical protein [Brachybacterium paraconglomeratum]